MVWSFLDILWYPLAGNVGKLLATPLVFCILLYTFVASMITSISWKFWSLWMSLSFLNLVLGNFRSFWIWCKLRSSSLQHRHNRAWYVSSLRGNSTSTKSGSVVLATRIFSINSKNTLEYNYIWYIIINYLTAT